jgi:pimeloyl-ACP methyl ester carboxylesterase
MSPFVLLTNRFDVSRRAALLVTLAGSVCSLTACGDAEEPIMQFFDAGALATDAGVDSGPAVDAGPAFTTMPALPGNCPINVNDSDCDKTRRPIVFVHGTVANADSFAIPALLLASNRYCPDRIRGVEYNSLILRAPGSTPDAGAALDAGSDAGTDAGPTADAGMDAGGVADAGRDAGRDAGSDAGRDAGRDSGSPLDAGSLLDSALPDAGAPDAALADAGQPSADAGMGSGLAGLLDTEASYADVKPKIDQAIAELLAATGADKVDILGHSQGGRHATRYVRENPGKIAHYINLAGGEIAENPGGVPTLCLSSTGDRPMNCGTTKNVVHQDEKLDHSAVASSAESFVEIFRFLNDNKDPSYRTVQCGRPVILEGKAPTLGDNSFIAGYKIEVYELTTDPRMRAAPVTTFNIGADGKFGPWEAKPNIYYEFKIIPPAGDSARPRRIYMRPFRRSDRLLRLTLETKNPVASMTSSMVNVDDAFAMFAIRRRERAFLFGRDTLKLDGFDAINMQNSAPRATTVALYLYDKAPSDKQSSGGSIISGPFINSADVYMQAMTPAFIKVEFNDSPAMMVPNWPSASEGPAIVVID